MATSNKSAVKASELIEALCSEEIDVRVFDDEDCNAIVTNAWLTSEAGEPCAVAYMVGYPEDTATYGVSAGTYSFTCLGVRYEASRSIDGCDDFSDETLSGREIAYDTNPETGEVYSEEDIFEAIHDNVSFPSYDPDCCEFEWNEGNRERAKDDLECDSYFAEDDEEGYYYARDEKGVIWLFNPESPMPEKGFTHISSDDAIRHLVETQQNFEEKD